MAAKTDKKEKVIGYLSNKDGIKINFSQLIAKNPGFNIKKFRASMSTKQKVDENMKRTFRKKGSFAITSKTLRAFTTSDDDLFITRIATGTLYDENKIDGLKCNIINGTDLTEEQCEFNCELLDYQVEMVNMVTASDNEWHPSKSLSYVCMPTGSGKTILGCGLIAERRKSTLVVVPAGEIAEQWINDLRSTLPKLRVGKLTTDVIKRDQLKNLDVAVGIVNTVRELDHSDVKYFGQIIMDEVHEYYTKVNSKVLWLTQCFKFGVGLSATPAERKDNLDTHVFKFIGHPIQCNLQMPKYKFQITIIEFYGNNEFCQPVVNNGIMCATTTIEKLAKQPERVSLVSQLAKELVDSGEEIFIFAEHRELLPTFKEQLTVDFKDHAEDIEVPEMGILRGGVKGAEAKEAREAKIVLTTYGYSRRGVSLKKKTALIMATPRRTPLAQIFGRITRTGGPGIEKMRKVYFVCDMKSPIKMQVDSIKEFAKNKGYEIITKKVRSEKKS